MFGRRLTEIDWRWKASGAESSCCFIAFELLFMSACGAGSLRGYVKSRWGIHKQFQIAGRQSKRANYVIVVMLQMLLVFHFPPSPFHAFIQNFSLRIRDNETQIVNSAPGTFLPAMFHAWLSVIVQHKRHALDRLSAFAFGVLYSRKQRHIVA